MVRIATLFLAFAAGAMAVNDCQAKDNACRTAPDANMSKCSADLAACCGEAFDKCRGAPDANMSKCAADNAACKGEA